LSVFSSKKRSSLLDPKKRKEKSVPRRRKRKKGKFVLIDKKKLTGGKTRLFRVY